MAAVRADMAQKNAVEEAFTPDKESNLEAAVAAATASVTVSLDSDVGYDSKTNKKASQGQFSIRPRDKNNPHMKKIRVVSTVAYYLSD